jgi:dTDP-4-amino-4,6-dideoxygalactose transaminase
MRFRTPSRREREGPPYCITKQPYFIDNKIRHGVVKGLGNTDLVMGNSLRVGVGPLLDDVDVDRIVTAAENFLKKA